MGYSGPYQALVMSHDVDEMGMSFFSSIMTSAVLLGLAGRCCGVAFTLIRTAEYVVTQLLPRIMSYDFVGVHY